MADRKRLRAYAKVNLGLNVLERRDDGYHEIDTLLTRVDVYDVLTVELGPPGIELIVEGHDVPRGAANLAYRAADLYLRQAGSDSGVRIRLRKNIPVAAGLGGGSSDAGAVLRALSRLLPAPVDLPALGAQIGSDVPFFVADQPAARARGRGELLERVKLPELHLVLINPRVAVSAADAYRAVTPAPRAIDLPDLLESLEGGGEPHYANDLEPAVARAHPSIEEAMGALRGVGLGGVIMSGSGSTCLGLADGPVAAEQLAELLRQRFPAWWVVATRTV